MNLPLCFVWVLVFCASHAIPSLALAQDKVRFPIGASSKTFSYGPLWLAHKLGYFERYIKANRNIVLRFLKGYLEGVAYVKQHRKESIEVVKKKLRIGAGQERNLEKSIDLLSDKYYEQSPYPAMRGVETVLGFVERDNPKASGADPKSFVDDSLLREIDRSGFVKTLYAR